MLAVAAANSQMDDLHTRRRVGVWGGFLSHTESTSRRFGVREGGAVGGGAIKGLTRRGAPVAAARMGIPIRLVGSGHQVACHLAPEHQRQGGCDRA